MAATAWPFGEDNETANEVIDDIEKACSDAGHVFFSTIRRLSGLIRRLLRETDFSALTPNESLTYAEIAQEIGDKNIAHQIAIETLARLGDEDRHPVPPLKRFQTDTG